MSAWRWLAVASVVLAMGAVVAAHVEGVSDEGPVLVCALVSMATAGLVAAAR